MPIENLTKENLSNYIAKGLKIIEISVIENVDPSSVSLRLKKYDIPYKRYHESNKYRIEEYIGKKYHSYTIISSKSFKTGELTPGACSGIRFECLCDCGNKFYELPRQIINNSRKTCGKNTCPYKIELNSINGNKSSIGSFTGYEEIYGSYWAGIRIRAENRNIDFNITIQEAWDLYVKQDRKCALTGVDLIFGQTWKDCNKGRSTASLDRIDSNKDYTIDNIQWVHKDINIMKMDLKNEDFIEWCKKVSMHNT